MMSELRFVSRSAIIFYCFVASSFIIVYRPYCHICFVLLQYLQACHLIQQDQLQEWRVRHLKDIGTTDMQLLTEYKDWCSC